MHYIHQLPALQGWVTPMYSQVTAPRCQPWTHQPPGKCSSLHVPCGIPEDVGCKNPLLWFAAAACRVCACLKHRENVCRSCLTAQLHSRAKCLALKKPRQARCAWVYLQGHCCARSHQQSPWGFLTHTAQGPDESESIQPPGFAQPAPPAPAANKGANSPQLLEWCSSMALSATCKLW